MMRDGNMNIRYKGMERAKRSASRTLDDVDLQDRGHDTARQPCMHV